jgi:uncharacterized protein YjiK
MPQLIKTLTVISIFTVILACKDPITYKSPQGYDLNKPVKYFMPDDLREVSGIAFNNGKADTLYGEEDENGHLYYLKLGDKIAKYTAFKDAGDFEDVAICNGQVIMLQSKGVIYTFPFAEVRSSSPAHVKKIENLLPEGEYEGISADDKTGLFYILCKHCADDKTSQKTSGYIFKLLADGTVQNAGNFNINVPDIQKLSGEKKVKFRPSALAKNKRTNEWYILSSVNSMLVVADANWRIKEVYSLNRSIFPQPEGIAFDEHNNLYISNEAQEVTSGNVLKFVYKGKN